MAEPVYGSSTGGAARAAAIPGTACGETTQDILNSLLITEQVALTLYYAGLTTPAIVSHPYLAGASGNLRQVASNGNRVNMANMLAALDQEQQHIQLLARAGARSAHSRVYFPDGTFAGLGYTRSPYTFLWVLDHIETALVGAYLAAAQHFAFRLMAGMAQFAARILGTEGQHRAMGRMVSGDAPANNVALEVQSFNCVGDVAAVLQPYLTGHGFPHGATPAVAIPSAAAVARLAGAHHSG